MSVVAAGVAAAFAVATGSNDGSSLLSAGLRVSGPRPLTLLAVLAGSLAAGPLLFGTTVATTLAVRLSPLAHSGARADALVAVVSAIAVVFWLNRRGLPTSSTLAVVGAITGAALGAGLPVAAGELGAVLGASLLAPAVAGAVALGLTRVVGPRLRSRHLDRRLHQAHWAAFVAQCLAYSANGGQKTFAVFALVLGTQSLHVPGSQLAVVVACFSVGVLLGLRRISAHLGSGIANVHLRHALAAEVASATVTFASAAGGVPLTMSQAVGGALVGAAASDSPHRVRAGAVARMGAAWALTLPASVALAAAAAVIVGLR